ARLERGRVGSPARDERKRERARRRRAGGEAEVPEGPEGVPGPPAARPGREGQRLVDADAKLLGRDERRNPAVTEVTGPPHRGLAVAADPQRHRLVERGGRA